MQLLLVGSQYRSSKLMESFSIHHLWTYYLADTTLPTNPFSLLVVSHFPNFIYTMFRKETKSSEDTNMYGPMVHIYIYTHT